MFDALGDRMKGYERVETARTLDKEQPIVVRIDGRSFSKFTRGFSRPFDADMSRCMIETTKTLVDKTHARVGYTQSDEITLLFFPEDYQELLFGGKVQKLSSVLAGLATAAFNLEIRDYFSEDVCRRLPHFDARVFNVPNMGEALNNLLWRIQDAKKNAVSMACTSVCSHKSRQGANSVRMLEMMSEKGIVFQDYPSFFRSGTLVRRFLEDRSLTVQELAKIPEKNRPAADVVFTRSVVRTLDVPDQVTYDWLRQAFPGPAQA